MASGRTVIALPQSGAESGSREGAALWNIYRILEFNIQELVECDGRQQRLDEGERRRVSFKGTTLGCAFQGDDVAADRHRECEPSVVG